MKKATLVVTSIAGPDNPVLSQLSRESERHHLPFVVVGDSKSPSSFHLSGCDFYSIDSQQNLDYELAKILPIRHYARKNLGYLIAMAKGAEIIIETDDDNYPLPDFWLDRQRLVQAHIVTGMGWVNVYKYFSKNNIWPRGFALEHITDTIPPLGDIIPIHAPIQQGLADGNPDVDAIYRLTQPLPFSFDCAASVALGNHSMCPFNSQNTTWFKEAFALLYLPSYCSFRMTDIWRSFVAQRIAWTCGWPILFHQSTVTQDRNDHSLMSDFKDEISGYTNNAAIVHNLNNLELLKGQENIPANMQLCYTKLVEMALVDERELILLAAWLNDIQKWG